MHKNWLTLILITGLVSSPALAKEDTKPVPGRDPNALDVAKTPITDLNVGRDNEIPPLLTQAVAAPYTLNDIRTCSQFVTAIEELDGVLGADIDLPQEERDRINAGRVGKWVVASFIPFRGLIREVSGANAQDRKVLTAVQAGIARRSFLKGTGAARGCEYPAAPAPAHIVQARLEELQADDKPKDETAAKKKKKVKKHKDTEEASAPATSEDTNSSERR